MKLKVCGIKTTEEAEALKQTGVDYIGLNFVPSSSRCISLETAQAILSVFKGSNVKTIALFQNQPLDMVEEYARQLGVDYVQLHGDEPAEYARSLQVPVMRAIAVDPDENAGKVIGFIKTYPADYFVLDRAKQGQGDPVDTVLASEIVTVAPDKICLAGGINPDNLAGIVSQVRPYVIDISSGVRTGDAIDMEKVSNCLQLIRLMPASRQ